MQEEVRVVLDAMGGDHAPEEMIKGACSFGRTGRCHIRGTGKIYLS